MGWFKQEGVHTSPDEGVVATEMRNGHVVYTHMEKGEWTGEWTKVGECIEERDGEIRSVSSSRGANGQERILELVANQRAWNAIDHSRAPAEGVDAHGVHYSTEGQIVGGRLQLSPSSQYYNASSEDSESIVSDVSRELESGCISLIAEGCGSVFVPNAPLVFGLLSAVLKKPLYSHPMTQILRGKPRT